jgi:hypothetical protein
LQEADKRKPFEYDVDGYDIITNAINDLLNQYPGLLEGEQIKFSTLGEESGIAFYPVTGAAISSEKVSVTGKVNQLCNYPFYIVYRTATESANSKIDIKEFLDNLGRWLERQTIKIGSETYKLPGYPVLTDGRAITEIVRQAPAYLDYVSENNVQNWVISFVFRYRNIFYRNK